MPGTHGIQGGRDGGRKRGKDVKGRQGGKGKKGRRERLKEGG